MHCTLHADRHGQIHPVGPLSAAVESEVADVLAEASAPAENPASRQASPEKTKAAALAKLMTACRAVAATDASTTTTESDSPSSEVSEHVGDAAAEKLAIAKPAAKRATNSAASASAASPVEAPDAVALAISMSDVFKFHETEVGDDDQWIQDQDLPIVVFKAAQDFNLANTSVLCSRIHSFLVALAFSECQSKLHMHARFLGGLAAKNGGVLIDCDEFRKPPGWRGWRLLAGFVGW